MQCGLSEGEQSTISRLRAAKRHVMRRWSICLFSVVTVGSLVLPFVRLPVQTCTRRERLYYDASIRTTWSEQRRWFGALRVVHVYPNGSYESLNLTPLGGIPFIAELRNDGVANYERSASIGLRLPIAANIILAFPPPGPYIVVRPSLWITVLGSAALAAVALTRARVRGLNRCGHCGYDLTGNVSGRCPECGTDVPGCDHAWPK